MTGRVAEGLALLEQAVAQGVAVGQMVFQPLWVAMHGNPPDVDQATTHYQQDLVLTLSLGCRLQNIVLSREKFDFIPFLRHEYHTHPFDAPIAFCLTVPLRAD